MSGGAMQETAPQVGLAAEADLPGILALQAANQPGRGGMLSAELPRERLAAMLQEMPQVVARRGGEVVGYLLASRPAATSHVPVVAAMLAAWPGSAEAAEAAGDYVYGPICVAASERGHGVAQALSAALQRLLPGREGVLFIRRDNPASLRAHARMGAREVAGFTQEGVDYAVLVLPG